VSGQPKRNDMHARVKIQPPLLVLICVALAHVLTWFVPLMLPVPPRSIIRCTPARVGRADCVQARTHNTYALLPKIFPSRFSTGRVVNKNFPSHLLISRAVSPIHDLFLQPKKGDENIHILICFPIGLIAATQI